MFKHFPINIHISVEFIIEMAFLNIFRFNGVTELKTIIVQYNKVGQC